MIDYLADGTMGISHVHQKILAFQIEMHDVLAMQVFHAKGCIHSNKKPLSPIDRPVAWILVCVNEEFHQEVQEDNMVLFSKSATSLPIFFV